MLPTSRQIYFVVMIAAIIFFVGQIMIITIINPVWNALPDCQDYLIQARMDYLSLEFYAPHPLPGFHPRPFTVPFMMQLANYDYYRMVHLQKYFYCLSAIVFTIAFGKYLSGYLVKTIFQLSLLYFFTWWNSVGWSEVPISECVSISFLLLWLAAILLFYKKRTWYTITFLVATSLFFSFTRDTWSYVVLVFFALNLVFYSVGKRRQFRLNLGLLVYAIALFSFQAYTIKIGGRTTLPVFNSIAGRVSQGVDGDRRVGVPEVGHVVDVVDRGGDVEVVHGACFS